METEAAGRIWGGEKKIIMNESFLRDGDSSAYKAGTKMNDGSGPSSNGNAGKEECESHTKEEGHKTQEIEDQLKEKKTTQGKPDHYNLHILFTLYFFFFFFFLITFILHLIYFGIKFDKGNYTFLDFI